MAVVIKQTPMHCNACNPERCYTHTKQATIPYWSLKAASVLHESRYTPICYEYKREPAARSKSHKNAD